MLSASLPQKPTQAPDVRGGGLQLRPLSKNHTLQATLKVCPVCELGKCSGSEQTPALHVWDAASEWITATCLFRWNTTVSLRDMRAEVFLGSGSSDCRWFQWALPQFTHQCFFSIHPRLLSLCIHLDLPSCLKKKEAMRLRQETGWHKRLSWLIAFWGRVGLSVHCTPVKWRCERVENGALAIEHVWVTRIVSVSLLS